MVSDNELMERVKGGDLDHLRPLYEKYNKPLFAYFFRTTSHAQTSEDLVQNVFYRILKYREKYRADGAFSTWLFSVAVNVKNDHLRKIRPGRTVNDVENLAVPADDDPAREAERNERAERLRAALDLLSPKQKDVIVLSRYHGLKYKDIAQTMKCSENSVKALMFRAVDKLRKVCVEAER